MSHLVCAGDPHSKPEADQTLPQKDQVQPHYVMLFCILSRGKHPMLASTLSTPKEMKHWMFHRAVLRLPNILVTKPQLFSLVRDYDDPLVEK